jgi:hypothetical protein
MSNKNCGSINSVNKTFIIETPPEEGACLDLTVNLIESCVSGGTITIGADLAPEVDSTFSIGTKTRRFRELNTLSGETSTFLITSDLKSPNLDLGLDSNNESRIITANNSIISQDTLFGGIY